jgi:hypothetical protein
MIVGNYGHPCRQEANPGDDVSLQSLEPVHRIHLTDPDHALTFWATGGPAGPVFCGGRQSLDDVLALARQHLHLKSLVIFSENPDHDLYIVPDDDRDEAQAKQHLGSGL